MNVIICKKTKGASPSTGEVYCLLNFRDLKSASSAKIVENFKFDLTIQADAATHELIVTQALFNLQPSVRTTITNSNFQPDRPIQLELALKPDLLSRLLNHASTIEEALEYLVRLSEEHEKRIGEQKSGGAGEPGSGGAREQGGSGDREGEGEGEIEIDPLLLTESWFCLSVTQTKDNGETTGYRTLWSYLPPSALAADNPDPDQVTQGITQFFGDLIEKDLDAIAQEFATESLDAISGFFKELAAAMPDKGDHTPRTQVFDAMLNFFQKDDWSFLRIQGEPALRLAFEGQNGSWNCYAKAREEAGQVVFYSLCPVAAPDDKRAAVAEFITRANFGMVLGNFELDYTDGEIRYKTSAVLEAGGQKSRGAGDVMREIVYTNVMIMDEYLPGLRAVLEEGVAPEQAIHLIEAEETSPSAI